MSVLISRLRSIEAQADLLAAEVRALRTQLEVVETTGVTEASCAQCGSEKVETLKGMGGVTHRMCMACGQLA